MLILFSQTWKTKTYRVISSAWPDLALLWISQELMPFFSYSWFFLFPVAGPPFGTVLLESKVVTFYSGHSRGQLNRMFHSHTITFLVVYICLFIWEKNERAKQIKSITGVEARMRCIHWKDLAMIYMNLSIRARFRRQTRTSTWCLSPMNFCRITSILAGTLPSIHTANGGEAGIVNVKTLLCKFGQASGLLIEVRNVIASRSWKNSYLKLRFRE